MQVLGLLLSIAGLVLPGYLVNRALRVRPAWLAAFPVSALLITFFVILAQIAGQPIQWGLTGAGLLLVSLASLAAIYRENRRSLNSVNAQDADELRWGDEPRDLRLAAVGLIAIILVLAAWRSVTLPLLSFDTFFRWEWLSRAMLEHRSLDFYPPRSSSDFLIYTYPDSIAPLVSSVYWWLYAGVGQPMVSLTAISVLLQLVCVLGLTAEAARQHFGRGAWSIALLAMGSTYLLLNGVLIAQETGFTAIAVAGQFCFARRAQREPRAGWVIATAMFAALGALSRDYGPALALPGLVMLLTEEKTRRRVPLFISSIVLIAGPWYVRTWMLTGNPFHPLVLPGLWHATNPVLTGVLSEYRKIFGLHNLTLAKTTAFLAEFLPAAGLLLLVGSSILVSKTARRWPALLLTFFLVVALWLYSIGSTSGGLSYSARVLTPCCVVLAIACGALGSRLNGNSLREFFFNAAQPKRVRVLASVLLLVTFCSAAYATFSVSIHGFGPSLAKQAWQYRVHEPIDRFRWYQQVIEQLNNAPLPSSGILTDDAGFAVALLRSSRFWPVMIWSPQVSFVFDRDLEPEEIARRLHEQQIDLVTGSAGSFNNHYLGQFTFYRDYLKHSETVAKSQSGLFVLKFQ